MPLEWISSRNAANTNTYTLNLQRMREDARILASDTVSVIKLHEKTTVILSAYCRSVSDNMNPKNLTIRFFPVVVTGLVDESGVCVRFGFLSLSLSCKPGRGVLPLLATFRLLAMMLLYRLRSALAPMMSVVFDQCVVA